MLKSSNFYETENESCGIFFVFVGFAMEKKKKTLNQALPSPFRPDSDHLERSCEHSGPHPARSETQSERILMGNKTTGKSRS